MGVAGDPRIVKSLSGRWSFASLVGQQLVNEPLGFFANRIPVRVIEGVLPNSHLVHDFQVSRAVKWRITAQKDEEDDSATPNIAFLVIIPGEDFGGDVVRLGC